MRTPSALLALTLAGLAGFIAAKSPLASVEAASSHHTRHAVNQPAEPPVTPVAGPSWLRHLNIPYGASTLGRGAGRYGPNADDPNAPGRAVLPIVARDGVVLTGADLYRLNCQACHTARGTGFPPEIKSALDLIQGSSLALVRQQFAQKGMAVRGATIRAEAAKARSDLDRRIREGGQRMPPRAHLQSADIDVLYAYLSELAHVPDSPRQSQRTVSWARLGEHVIKGTCHICHDAAGPRPSSDEMLIKGVIPPLSVIRADNSRSVFISKAKNGAAVATGPFHYRGRMPVFYYLEDEELAAAYDFLVAYPPLTAAAR